MRHRLFIAVLVCTLAAPVAQANDSAQSLDKALAAMLKQDYGLALNILRPMATSGHAEAQYYLGYLYRSGSGVARDDKQAHDWYLKAAAGGHATAAYQARLIELETRR
jgi:TPR repeat protein